MIAPMLTPELCLPADHARACLAGRAMRPGVGPAVVALRDEELFDISAHAPTLSALCEREDASALVRSAPGEPIGSVAAILANSAEQGRDEGRPWLLAPCDLQVLKAAGVTFARSMVERVIEERARGNPDEAATARARMGALVGGDLGAVVPGSEAAVRLKQALLAQGLWSQYLEVGIGPDAEVFTKAPVLAAVGLGADIGIHPASRWNNPEPEVVLAVASSGRVVGASLGNDVNLRDFEGRSALLLSKAKDNNASAAIDPFLRLFDAAFTIETIRRAEVRLEVLGADGFRLAGHSSMAQISRDPLEIVTQTVNANHQYPDGFLLYLGTMFAPIEDRHEPGGGFTHEIGDIVTIATPSLGALVNRVERSDRVRPWRFGIGALMRNLAARGLLR